MQTGYLDYYISNYRRVNGSYNETKWNEGTEVNIKQVKSTIKALYDNGAPFFTKDALREIQEQLKGDLRVGQKISVRGLDGVTVEFDVIAGQVIRPAEADTEYVAMKPCIHYTSPISLLHHPYGSDLVCCSLEIHHPVALRHKVTKERIGARPIRDFDTVKASFMEVLQRWDSSTTCLELQATLNQVKFPQSFKISKIVAFACGSISLDSITEDMSTRPLYQSLRERSSYQHALLRTLQNTISNLDGCHNIQCFAQDPIYTSVDSKVLGEFGISILDDPEGFIRVDDTTLVVSLMPNVPVKQIIVDIARPAMIIWDSSPEDGVYFTDPTSSRVNDFLNSFYHESKFPNDEENFNDVAIYTRFDA
ncbi:hypothetical protein MauCBS54593_003373 [Microsporum audouinii]